LIGSEDLSKYVFRFAIQNIKDKVYSTVISPVVLYGLETWYLKLREGHRVRVFEKRVLRKIFGPKRDEIAGGYKNCAKKKLHDLHSTNNIHFAVCINDRSTASSKPSSPQSAI
jgi:hypothetical protein